MTETMIERVARHCERRINPQWTKEEFDTWWSGDPFFCEHVTGWPDGFRGTRKQRRMYEARSTIEAMRHPTPGMKAAAATAVGNYDIAHDAYVRAIDAALSEGGE